MKKVPVGGAVAGGISEMRITRLTTRGCLCAGATLFRSVGFHSGAVGSICLAGWIDGWNIFERPFFFLEREKVKLPGNIVTLET